MSQLDEKFSRQRIILLVITLPRCSNVYGVNDGAASLCQATKLGGDECYNTYDTCQDKVNFVKTTVDWKICTKDVTPFPGEEYWEPILDSTTMTPTEILETKTAKARIKFSLLNYKADTVASELKIAGDPYTRNRTTISGTRLRKLLARHGNIKGSLIKQYEGALGDTFDEYNETFNGNLWDFNQNVKGDIDAESEDLLTKLEDRANMIPPRVEGKLVNEITASQTSFIIDKPTQYPDAPNYLFLGAGATGELVKYGVKNDTTGEFSALERGQEGTTAQEFSEGEKVARVQWWPFQNPFDIALDILDQSDLSSFVNTGSFTNAKTFPEEDVNHSAFITEPTIARVLYDELMKPLDVSTWVAETLLITVKRNVNDVTGTPPALTEDQNIWKDTQQVDLNDKAIRNAATLVWMNIPGRKSNDDLSYLRTSGYVDGDSVSANDKNEVLLETMRSRFIRFGDTAEETVENWVAKALRRYIRRRVTRRPIIDFKVEFRDFQRMTGENVNLTTDKLEEIDGTGFSGSLFMLTRRAPGTKDIALRAIKEPEALYAAWAPERLAGVAFEDAEDADKRAYGAWADENGRIPDGSAYGAPGKIYY